MTQFSYLEDNQMMFRLAQWACALFLISILCYPIALWIVHPAPSLSSASDTTTIVEIPAKLQELTSAAIDDTDDGYDDCPRIVSLGGIDAVLSGYLTSSCCVFNCSAISDFLVTFSNMYGGHFAVGVCAGCMNALKNAPNVVKVEPFPEEYFPYVKRRKPVEGEMHSEETNGSNQRETAR